MGHVNNAVYFSYLEMARIDYFTQLRTEKWDWVEEGVVVAHNRLDYKTPIFFGERVIIDTRCIHIGEKSLTLHSNIYKIKEEDRILCASGECVLVSFNHRTQQSQAIPEAWRGILTLDLHA